MIRYHSMKDAYREDRAYKKKLCGIQSALSNGRLIWGHFILPRRVRWCRFLVLCYFRQHGTTLVS